MRAGQAVGVGAVLLAGAALGAPGYVGPTATYWMSASTTTGMAATGAAMAGGGRPSMGSMFAMGMGGGFDPNAATKTLVLQLGSRERPQGPPTAEHDPPQGLGAGPVLPLVTPVAQSAAPREGPAEPPRHFQQPHGRMLIFWGCGEHAGPGQPVVIDFATLGQSGGAERMMALTRGLAVSAMQPPSPSRSATYGEWPNTQSRASIPGSGSLVGGHLIKGNYSPPIQLALGPAQDFLAPLRMTANQKNPSGSATLGWGSVDRAGGYLANMMGAQGGDQIVMWTSSNVESSAFALPQYLSDGEIRRLVASGVLMPSAQVSCVVPQEAVTAAGRGGFFTLAAYGGESNFASAPRDPIWTVKLRYRSSTSGIVGVNMGGRGAANDRSDQPPQKKPSRGASFLQGLGSVIP